ncbi:hypothetical protein EDC04DRAFT_2601653 [Pisolithus marmoratus]|nr:hypothetical protein EDC04DRAFT_2601653 [Pisolithus marmoratus]
MYQRYLRHWYWLDLRLVEPSTLDNAIPLITDCLNGTIIRFHIIKKYLGAYVPFTDCLPVASLTLWTRSLRMGAHSTYAMEITITCTKRCNRAGLLRAAGQKCRESANHPNDLDDQAHPSGQLQLLEKLDSQLEGVGQHGSNLENIRIPEVNADIHALDTIAVALQLVPWRTDHENAAFPGVILKAILHFAKGEFPNSDQYRKGRYSDNEPSSPQIMCDLLTDIMAKARAFNSGDANLSAELYIELGMIALILQESRLSCVSLLEGKSGKAELPSYQGLPVLSRYQQADRARKVLFPTWYQPSLSRRYCWHRGDNNCTRERLLGGHIAGVHSAVSSRGGM